MYNESTGIILTPSMDNLYWHFYLRIFTYVSNLVPALNLQCWVSTEREVVLRPVTLRSSGDYQCEVIGEHPNFRKEVLKGRLTVYCKCYSIYSLVTLACRKVMAEEN